VTPPIRRSLEDLYTKLDVSLARGRRELAKVPETPEEHTNESLHKRHAWEQMRDELRGLIELAYMTIPRGVCASEHASTRTALLEVAINEMTEKLIEYPSSPYTLDSTHSLGNAMNALKTSMDIDAMNDKKEKP
jgi:hypothetical protein